MGSMSLAILGIIPANTGRISVLWRLLRAVWDHPREYGENIADGIRGIQRRGSSPRIRGEYSRPVSHLVSPGIIPANTGRISRWRNWTAARRDHPREYGENPRIVPCD